VEHKTYVAVDESGTEAAAVTSVGVGATAAPIDPPDYTADRPFIFAIREKNSGLVIFAGVINNPLLTSSGD
jgi:serpin B